MNKLGVPPKGFIWIASAFTTDNGKPHVSYSLVNLARVCAIKEPTLLSDNVKSMLIFETGTIPCKDTPAELAREIRLLQGM